MSRRKVAAAAVAAAVPQNREKDQGPAAEWVALDRIHPWEKNPRRNEGAVAQVAASIKRFGFGAPIVARKADGEIIAGHTRYRAAVSLGLRLVPVRFVDLDPVEAHLLALADNKVGEIAEWNDEALAKILSELRHAGVDAIDGTGFDGVDIERLIREAGLGGAPVDEDDLEQLDEPSKLLDKWRVEPGQTWAIGPHRLLCGDSSNGMAVARLFANRRALWMWTDPPYGVEYVGKTADGLEIKGDADVAPLLAAAFAAADAVLDDGAAIYVCHPAVGISVQFGAAFLAAGWHFHETLIWAKDALVLGHSDYHFNHEPMIYGWKGKNRRWYAGRDQVSVIDVARPKVSTWHPTMKPLALIERTVGNNAKKGDVGFDPFAGSGSTLCAAHQMGLVCFAVEIDPKYCAVILQRMSGYGLTPTVQQE